MMWRRCVILFVLSAWQAGSARTLVNLVEPQVTAKFPGGSGRWKMFDRDLSTYQKTSPASSYYITPEEVSVDFTLETGWPIVSVPGRETLSPTDYRITMPAHVSSAKYPASWSVTVKDKNYNLITLDEVTGAVFKKGVYEGTLSKQIDIRSFVIVFDQKIVTLAEVEVLGPRSALNRLWPLGAYPCSQRLALITPKKGPRRIFSESLRTTSKDDLRVVFNAREHWATGTKFYYDGFKKPVVIGAKRQRPSMVHEIALSAYVEDGPVAYPPRVRLEASFCRPRCPRLGSEGWVAIADETTMTTSWNFPRMFVKKPELYRAYRLKFFRTTVRGGPGVRVEHSFELQGIFFLGCPTI